MADSKYFVVRNGLNGSSVCSFDRETLLEILESGQYDSGVFMDRLWNPEMRHWGNQILVIKGGIVIPRAVGVVKRYEITGEER